MQYLNKESQPVKKSEEIALFFQKLGLETSINDESIDIYKKLREIERINPSLKIHILNILSFFEENKKGVPL